MVRAETAVPPAYSAEKAVRERPVPARNSSTKTETRKDWPGAEAKKASPANVSMLTWWRR